MTCRFVLVPSATNSSQATYRLEGRIYGRSHSPCDRPPSWSSTRSLPAPEVSFTPCSPDMDINQETSIFNTKLLRTSLEQLDLNEVAKRTLELVEDYMPGCAWLDANGEIHFAETMGEADGLVLCQATEFAPHSPDEVPLLGRVLVGRTLSGHR